MSPPPSFSRCNKIERKCNISDKSMLFAGTSVLTGRALAVVTKTGLDTEVGMIAKKVTDTEESKSPLTLRMERFSKQITVIIIVIAIITHFFHHFIIN